MLVRLGAASEEDLVRWLCREYRLPIIDVTGVAPMSQALARVPYEMAERHAILPLGIDGSTLTVAIADPSNLDGLNEVKFCSGCTLRIGISATLKLEHAIAQFYGAKMTRAAG